MAEVSPFYPCNRASSLPKIIPQHHHLFLQVVTLTEEVLAEATQHQQNDGAAPSSSQPSRSAPAPIAAITQAPEVKLPSALPPQVADQIRIAQQRAALAGQGPAAWAIGARVQARIGGDGLWYARSSKYTSVEVNFVQFLNQFGVFLTNFYPFFVFFVGMTVL